MKELWIEVTNSLPKRAAAILSRFKDLHPTIVTKKANIKVAKTLGLRTASKENSDILLLNAPTASEIKRSKATGKKNCIRRTVKNRADENEVYKAASRGVDYIIVSCPNWKVIPLENLIAKLQGKSKLLAEVSDLKAAKLALGSLELGVDGVVLKTSKVEDVTKVASMMTKLETRGEKRVKVNKIILTPAKILSCKELGLGARVCVDTCDLMIAGEGILVGCQSSGLFLVQAEVELNPHVEPRPFRVNAGPVSLYILSADGKTKYLSELKAGAEVSVLDRASNMRTAIIGRIKIERRPLILVEAKVRGHKVKTILQNAETIHLVTPTGSKSVRELKAGDEVLVYHQLGGRHFGELVKEETVVER